jgi:nicotinate-nucleotide adenylyltransferase
VEAFEDTSPDLPALGPDSAIWRPGVHPKLRYGILGGTFDPPHLGHLIVAQEVYARLGLDRVYFIPTGLPPHKPGREVSAARDRCAMVQRAIASDKRFAFSSIEVERPGPSYTADTLRALRAEWGAEVEIALVLGWDMLLYLPQWHDVAGLLASTDAVVAVHRPGFAAGDEALSELEGRVPGLRERLALVPCPQVDISATMVRTRVASGLPIHYLVPEAVAAYIAEHGLFRTPGNVGGARQGGEALS